MMIIWFYLESTNLSSKRTILDFIKHSFKFGISLHKINAHLVSLHCTIHSKYTAPVWKQFLTNAFVFSDMLFMVVFILIETLWFSFIPAGFSTLNKQYISCFLPIVILLWKIYVTIGILIVNSRIFPLKVFT